MCLNNGVMRNRNRMISILIDGDPYWKNDMINLTNTVRTDGRFGSSTTGSSFLLHFWMFKFRAISFTVKSKTSCRAAHMLPLSNLLISVKSRMQGEVIESREPVRLR